jgi:hypothetical protein
MTRFRELVGDIGWWILIGLAIPIHVATVIVAFEWYGGVPGLIAATLSAIVPVVPEIFWAARYAYATGTLLHWYVFLVIVYPGLWLIWLIGGTAFGARKG